MLGRVLLNIWIVEFMSDVVLSTANSLGYTEGCELNIGVFVALSMSLLNVDRGSSHPLGLGESWLQLRKPLGSNTEYYLFRVEVFRSGRWGRVNIVLSG